VPASPQGFNCFAGKVFVGKDAHQGRATG
jgi:hypothetical protein